MSRISIRFAVQFGDEPPLVADVASLDFDPRTTTFAELHADMAKLMHETADYLGSQEALGGFDDEPAIKLQFLRPKDPDGP